MTLTVIDFDDLLISMSTNLTSLNLFKKNKFFEQGSVELSVWNSKILLIFFYLEFRKILEGQAFQSLDVSPY